MNNGSSKDLIQIVLIYVIIAISGLVTWHYLSLEDEVMVFLIADIVMTVVCFIFSILKKNSSVYDAYWSVIPFYFVLLWIYVYYQQLEYYHWLTFLVVSLWSWRLTLNWARSWSGFGHEDWRYINLAKQSGSFYPFVNFLGIHVFPTFMVFAGMWPLFFIFNNGIDSLPLFYIGIVCSLLGTILEYFADNQLARFRSKQKKVEELLDTGLWGRSRNPNYLGEILFWIGLFLVGLSYSAPLYTGAGVIVMISLFVFISIPMKEERMIERRPSFEDYKKRVPMLIPGL